MRSSPAAASLLLALAACNADAGPAVERRTIGDTSIVASSAPLIRDTLEPREVVRFGRADGPPEFLFSWIFSFTVGPDGSVFVHDRDDGIRHFSRDGATVTRIARQGQGPGETDYLLGMSVDAAGQLAALDLGNQRVLIFGGDGNLVRGFRRPQVRPRYGDGTILFGADGSLWIGMHSLFADGSALEHPLPVFLRLSTEGEVVDTIWTPADAAAECTTLSEPRYRVGYWEDTRQPFVPKTIWALGRDGSFGVGCPATYSLDVHRPDGTVVRIRRPWTKAVLSDEARDWLPGQAGIPVIPPELPVYSQIILPGDGRVWVWPNQMFEKVPFGTTHRWAFPWTGSFDVFLEDGVWLATVRLPEGARFNGYPTEPSIQIAGDTIWAVSQDSMGVQAIVRYEVPELSQSSRQVRVRR